MVCCRTADIPALVGDLQDLRTIAAPFAFLAGDVHVSKKYISSFWKPSPGRSRSDPPARWKEKAPGDRLEDFARGSPAKSLRISSKAFDVGDGVGAGRPPMGSLVDEAHALQELDARDLVVRARRGPARP